MKSSRHDAIIDIINSYNIETQDDLIQHLNERGYKATQATISRDLRELKLVKVTAGNSFKYSLPEVDAFKYSGKYRTIFKEIIEKVDVAGNLIILKTLAGMAQAAAAAVDGIGWNEIVGTLAGDDTVFIAMRTPEKATEYSEAIEEMLR